ncbi:unnamed protein product, partial [Mycena citricolor]
RLTSAVVREEPDRDIVTRDSDVHDITAGRVDVVVRGASSSADDVKSVSVQMERMLYILRASCEGDFHRRKVWERVDRASG